MVVPSLTAYPSGSHEGEGLFFVEPPRERSASVDGLRSLASYLIQNADSVRTDRGAYSTQFNNFVRWAAGLEQSGQAADSLLARELVLRVREAISPGREEESRID